MGGEDPTIPTCGVKPMSIAGRVVRERERLSGMTEEERAWRKRWLADQHLTSEPRKVPGLENEFRNPIRRVYQAPLNFIFNKFVAPWAGEMNSRVFRFYTGKILMGIYGALAIHYYLKYNTNTWEGKGRWRIIENSPAVYPGDPGYPYVAPERKPYQYHDRGFGQSVLGQKFPQYKELNECNDK